MPGKADDLSAQFEKLLEREAKPILSRFEKWLEERRRERRPLNGRGRALTSELTVKQYLWAAKQFLTFALTFRNPPLKDELARKFLDRVKKRQGFKPRTMLVLYSAIRNLYAAMGWPFTLRWTEFVDPSTIEDAPEMPFLQEEEMEKLVDAAIKANDLRASVILILMRCGGMRPREIANLKVGNIKYYPRNGKTAYLVEYQTLKKGGKRRFLIPEKYAPLVKQWLSYLRDNLNPKLKKKLEKTYSVLKLPPDFPLFPRFAGSRKKFFSKFEKFEEIKPISYVQVWRIVKRYTTVLGFDHQAYSKVTPYGFRRGILTKLLESGLSDVKIDKAFGWKTSMSRRYYKRPGVEIAEEVLEVLEA